MTVEAGLVDPLVRSSLLIALAWAAAVGLRGGGSASMRHLVWLLGLLSVLLIPLMATLLPRLPLPVLPETAAAPVAAAASLPPAPILAAPPAAAPAPAAAIGLGDLVHLLYLSVAAGLLGRLALGHWLLARLWRRARPIEDRLPVALLAPLAASLGIRRRVAVRMAAGPAMPMTWGSLRPRILVPVESRGWSEERLRVVLLHELGHVARHDSLSRAAAAIVCALYWFNPAVWYAVRQMRREQEHACDDLVLSAGARASVYARSLLEAAHAFQAPRIVGSLSVAMASPSELERRLTAIVAPGSRRRASLRFLAGCGAAALVATSVAASVVPVPAAGGLTTHTSSRPIRRGGAPYEVGPIARAAAPLAPIAARAPETAAGPAPAVAPAAPIAPAARIAPVAPVPAAPARAELDYGRALAEYHRDLRAYHAAERRYNRDLALYNRELAALSRDGILANSGNSGNSGNTGNPGQPARPAHGSQPAIPAIPPIPPIMPTSPTWPTPRLPPKQGP